MTEIDSKSENKARPEDDHGLEEKIQEYHRRGGPDGGHSAKAIEGEVTSAGIASSDTMKKGRPPST